MDRIQELLSEIDRLRMENMNLNSTISDLEDELEYMKLEIDGLKLDIEAHRALNRDLINKNKEQEETEK